MFDLFVFWLCGTQDLSFPSQGLDPCPAGEAQRRNPWATRGALPVLSEVRPALAWHRSCCVQLGAATGLGEDQGCGEIDFISWWGDDKEFLAIFNMPQVLFDFFFFLNYFNWRLIILQYCIGILNAEEHYSWKFFFIIAFLTTSPELHIWGHPTDCS